MQMSPGRPRTGFAPPPVPASRPKQSRLWAFVLVIVLVAFAYYLFDRWGRVAAFGLVVIDERSVNAERDGLIDRMSVAEFNAYPAGQPAFATVDTEVLDEIEALEVDLKITQSRIEEKAMDLKIADSQELWSRDERLYWLRSEMDEAEADMQRIKAEYADAIAQIPAKEFNFQRIAGLAKDGMASPQELQDAIADYESVKGRAKELRAAITARRLQMQTLAQSIQRPEPERVDVAKAVGPLYTEAELQRTRLEQLKERAAARVIEMPIAATVTKVHKNPGEYVKAGDSVLTVIEPDTKRIVAYFPKEQADNIYIGQPVTIRTAYTPELKGTIVRKTDKMIAAPPPVARKHPQDTPLWPVDVELDELGRKLLVTGSLIRVYPQDRQKSIFDRTRQSVPLEDLPQEQEGVRQ